MRDRWAIDIGRMIGNYVGVLIFSYSPFIQGTICTEMFENADLLDFPKCESL